MPRFPGGTPSAKVSQIAATLPARDRIVIAACIGLITLLAWFYLVHLDRQMAADLQHMRMMRWALMCVLFVVGVIEPALDRSAIFAGVT
jgi:predicted metal-binding membrane protein